MKNIKLLVLLAAGAALFVAQFANANAKKYDEISATDTHIAKKIKISDDTAKGILDGKGVKGKPSPAAGISSGTLGEPLPVGGQKYAIVIGICKYPIGDLCVSDGDSYYFRQGLIDKYGFAPENIRWFRDNGGNGFETPTRSAVMAAIGEIAGKATASDEVVFFFSGHGGDGIAGDNDAESRDEAIIVHNDDSSGISYIWDGELRDAFANVTARMLFVFDSCLAGGMNDVAAANRVIAMATGETNSAYVYSDGELGEGVFSHFFSGTGMDGAAADKNKDSILSAEEAFDYAKPKVQSLIKRQTPTASDNFSNDLGL